jgi:tetratricopeptide (TPR) repeat protein
MQIFITQKSDPSGCCLFLLFCLIILISYSNSFQSSWQLDDKPNIIKNNRIHLTELSPEQFWQASHAKPGSGGFYRPVACISLALNWFFGQSNVLGYHIVNFFIHCWVAWFLFLAIKTLFFTPRLFKRYPPDQIVFISATAALIWALNPIHTQAVTYIVQRMTSLAAMFSVLAILCYLKARLSGDTTIRTTFLVCAVISYLLAIFSKENAVIIILTLPIFEILFFQRTLSRHLLYKMAGGIITGLIISIIAGFALRPELFDFILNFYSNRPFTLSERLLTEQRIVLHYLSQLFFPAPGRLSVEHDVILSTSVITPWTTLAAILINGLLILFAVRFNRKEPLLSLAILFYYICHLIESTVVPLELVFEHRNYLPSLFLFIPVAQLFQRGITKLQQDRLAATSIVGLVVIIFTVMGYATYERNKAWRTEESLWQDTMKKAPNSARPLAVLALKLAWGPNPSEAKYRKALELIERSISMQMRRTGLIPHQLGNMASIYSKLGEHNKAIAYYKRALAFGPTDESIRYNFCKTLIMTGNFSQAKDELNIILGKGLIHVDYFNMLGFIYLWTGQPENALPTIQKALHYASGRPDILLTIGKCYSLLGSYNKAKWYLSRARKNGRDDTIVSLCIIENALRKGAIDEAKKELQQSIMRFPLTYFLQPLHAPSEERFREVPLANEILTPFIQSQLPIITKVILP